MTSPGPTVPRSRVIDPSLVSPAHPPRPPSSAAPSDCAETASGSEAGGLAPSAAEDWLEFQRRYALIPERVRARLVALGAAASPGPLLASPPPGWAGAPSARGQGGHSGSEASARSAAADGAARRRMLDRLERDDVRVVPFGQADYPERLAALEDAPAVLLVRGRPAVLANPAVAIVGARAATRAGRRAARRLAGDLAARGITIVSGLARGIDAEAHRGALEAGGRTIAVLACGIDRLYPPEHARLAEAIEEAGALVSEMPPGTPPRREFFPLRNRIISGLSLGVLVAEARVRSGSLITVRHALAQGREVFVLPGATEGPFAAGSNRLLREGARSVVEATDLLEDLGWSSPDAGGPGQGDASDTSDTSEAEGADAQGLLSLAPAASRGAPGRREGEPLAASILAQLERSPARPEELVVRLSAEPGEVGACLIELELAGAVATERDGRVHRVWR